MSRASSDITVTFPDGARRSVRRAGPSRTKRHPFAADPDWLREGLYQIKSIPDVPPATDFLLILPGTEQAPQASPYLFREDVQYDEATELALWVVPALTLGPDQSLSQSRFGKQKGAGNFSGSQSPQGAQRQGDLPLKAQ